MFFLIPLYFGGSQSGQGGDTCCFLEWDSTHGWLWDLSENKPVIPVLVVQAHKLQMEVTIHVAGILLGCQVARFAAVPYF